MKCKNIDDFYEVRIQTNLIHYLVFNILWTRLLSNSLGCLKGEAVELPYNNVKPRWISLDDFIIKYKNGNF